MLYLPLKRIESLLVKKDLLFTLNRGFLRAVSECEQRRIYEDVL